MSVAVNIGHQRPLYPSDPGYIASIDAQMKQITDNLQAVFDQMLGASVDIMLEALEPTFEKARDVYCPIKTGDLRASGYLESNGDNQNPHVEIGFGKGGEPQYALYVHEMTGVFHEPPTQAKFLQRAVLEDLPQIYERLAHGYQEFMNVGF